MEPWLAVQSHGAVTCCPIQWSKVREVSKTLKIRVSPKIGMEAEKKSGDLELKVIQPSQTHPGRLRLPSFPKAGTFHETSKIPAFERSAEVPQVKFTREEREEPQVKFAREDWKQKFKSSPKSLNQTLWNSSKPAFRKILSLLRRTFVEHAFFALWIPRHADVSAMENQLMREFHPPFTRKNTHEILFHFFRSGLFRKSHPLRKTQNVRIYHDSVRNVEERT